MSDADLIDAKRVVRIFRREKRIIFLTLLCFLLAAVVYIQKAPVLYTAKASILLDKTVSTAVSEIATLRRLGFENESILSEIETLKSDRVLEKVISDLKKKDGDEIRDYVGQEDIRDKLIDNLGVSRVSETYVLEVLYKNESPDVAAIVANAFSNAYIEDQLDLKSDMSLRTVDWLKEKLTEINQQIIDKNRKLMEYRVRYNEHQNRNRALGHENSAWTLKELDRLETETKAYEELYQSYLSKLKSISVQDNFPVTETRIINVAVPPTEKSQPKTNLVLAAAIVLGLGLGIFFAIIRDVRDATIRRAGQVTGDLKGEVLGFLPPASHRVKAKLKSPWVLEESLERGSFLPEEIECFRAILNKGSVAAGGHVVGVVSDMSPELSAQFVEGFASFCALGTATTVVDGHVKFGGGKNGNAPIDRDAAWFTSTQAFEAAKRRFDGSSTVLVSADSSASELLIPLYSKKNIAASLHKAREDGSLVIVNCPPLVKKSEFESYAEALDGVVILLRWGESKINEVKFLLDGLNLDKAKIHGFAFVDADMERMKKFYGHKTIKEKY